MCQLLQTNTRTAVVVYLHIPHKNSWCNLKTWWFFRLNLGWPSLQPCVTSFRLSTFPMEQKLPSTRISLSSALPSSISPWGTKQQQKEKTKAPNMCSTHNPHSTMSAKNEPVTHNGGTCDKNTMKWDDGKRTNAIHVSKIKRLCNLRLRIWC